MGAYGYAPKIKIVAYSFCFLVLYQFLILNGFKNTLTAFFG